MQSKCGMNKYIHNLNRLVFFVALSLLVSSVSAQQERLSVIEGTVTCDDAALSYATVFLKDTQIHTTSDENGRFSFKVPAGRHTLCVRYIGYELYEKSIQIKPHEKQTLHVRMEESDHNLEEVVVVSSGVSRVKESAYNAIAIDAKSLHNSTLDLGNALAKVPGVKLRESGGVGSDMQFSLDGFSGRHIKFFIDGVPLEGAGSSFGINNIPVNFAERIEVYRGVIPVSFGADALGGVVNIVTGNKRRTFVDASYSFGSFNTHKSYVNVGHTTDKGLTFEINAFQNYSDNSYHVYTAVKDLDNGQIDESKIEKVKRFNDTYHNETLIGKFGFTGTKFADRLLVGINLSQNEKEIQNGVRQDVVFGKKERSGHSVMPSFEYRKRNLFAEGLNVSLTANYNRNTTHNLDTATYLFNWRGESRYNNGKLGEQSYQDAEFRNDNWNMTFNTNYHLNERHSFIFNHVLTAFDRRTVGNSENQSASSDMPKTSRKNISGLSYRFSYEQLFNVSVFGKYYNQYSKGPRNQATGGSYDYVLFSETVDAIGYGAAGTLFFLKDFQAKVSYEKTYRLPTTDELFGDEDLELGSVGLEPEKSDNLNVSVSYSKTTRKHSFYIEGGLLYRDTKDYIRRVTNRYTGGLYYASHENHGRVKTVGANAEFRYGYSKWFSVGGNLTSQNIRDNERYVTGNTLQESTTYKVRVPNIPYFFFNTDASFFYHDLLGKGNVLTLTYGNLYVHEFPLYWENHGSASTKLRVPEQFSHDLSLIYSVKNGRYNFSLECRNFTDERLYDNFSLQKAGRAFYGKVRYFFGK